VLQLERYHDVLSLGLQVVTQPAGVVFKFTHVIMMPAHWHWHWRWTSIILWTLYFPTFGRLIKSRNKGLEVICELVSKRAVGLLSSDAMTRGGEYSST
jgi:hypothetical protein